MIKGWIRKFFEKDHKMQRNDYNNNNNNENDQNKYKEDEFSRFISLISIKTDLKKQSVFKKVGKWLFG